MIRILFVCHGNICRSSPYPKIWQKHICLLNAPGNFICASGEKRAAAVWDRAFGGRAAR